MSLKVTDKAPAFTLPDAPGQMVDVGAAFGDGPVVLLFFPFAFSSVCTTEFCTIAGEWSDWTGLGAQVFGVSVDSAFVVQKFRESEQLPFSILSDFNKDVCRDYGVLHDDEFGQKGVSKRAAFVVDRSGAIAYAWVSDDAGVQVDFAAIKAAVESA